MSTVSNTPSNEGADASGDDTRPVADDTRPVADDTRPVPVAGATPVAESRRRILSRERDEFGGVKVGSAFFGWLAATGMAVLLTALATAAGAAIGLTKGSSVADVAAAQGANAKTVGLVGGIALLVILFVAYYCGGYVAGRMARFDGLKQGFAVWLWAVVIAIIVAVIAWIAGSKYDVLSSVNVFPRIPVGSGDLTTGGIIALVAVVLASLIGALLGGVSGMHFHRKVDRAGITG
jgi:hypothetical protein